MTASADHHPTDPYDDAPTADADGGGAVTWMPLAELLELVGPAYGGESWEAALDLLAEDPVEAATVDALRDELRAAGRFEAPVVIDRAGGIVANGMHRIAASVAEGAARIAVTEDYGAERDEDWVEISFTVAGARSDETDDLVVSALRSFTADGHWTETNAMGSVGNIFTGDWHWPGRDEAVLGEALIARARAWGLEITVTAIGRQRAAEDDNGDDSEAGRPA